MAIELELTVTLDDDTIDNLSCQFPIAADYDGVGMKGSKFVFYLWYSSSIRKMIFIFLGEDFFGFYYFYNKVHERTQNEWQKHWFLCNYLSVSELFRNFVAVKFKNYRAYEAYWTFYSAVFDRISVLNYWHNNGTRCRNSLWISTSFKLQRGRVLRNKRLAIHMNVSLFLDQKTLKKWEIS